MIWLSRFCNTGPVLLLKMRLLAAQPQFAAQNRVESLWIGNLGKASKQAQPLLEVKRSRGHIEIDVQSLAEQFALPG